MSEYNDNLRQDSDYLFINKVYPEIYKNPHVERKMPRLIGRLKNMYEGLQFEGNIHFKLDLNNGIDFAVAHNDSRPVLFLGTRVQQNVNFRSFSITYLKSNECAPAYDKLKWAIEDGCYPKYTIQAYTKGSLTHDDIIDEIGIIDTIEFMNLINNPLYQEITHRQSISSGKERFYYINFEDAAKYAPSFIHIKP